MQLRKQLKHTIMKSFAYNAETNEIEVIINGETNDECLEKFNNLNLDQDLFYLSFSDAQLIETTETYEI